MPSIEWNKLPGIATIIDGGSCWYANIGGQRFLVTWCSRTARRAQSFLAARYRIQKRRTPAPMVVRKTNWQHFVEGITQGYRKAAQVFE